MKENAERRTTTTKHGVTKKEGGKDNKNIAKLFKNSPQKNGDS